MMKKTYLVATALLLSATLAKAQETYQNTKMVDNDLNGTARYVGMGGAMEALGADLSTISSNPAGLGLFRSSRFLVSGGMVSQQDASTRTQRGADYINFDGHKTLASFDQIGFVWAKRSGYNSYLNLGVNYHKSRNFDQILNAANALSGASQNKLTSMKYLNFAGNGWDDMHNGVDANYAELMGDKDKQDNFYIPYENANQFLFGQYQRGYIGEYDFAVSGNLNDRVYLGLTIGVHDVHYKSNSMYAEYYDAGYAVDAYEQLAITGTGYDVKFGAIFRPIASSPLRFGAYFNTPVFYDLRMSGASDIITPSKDGSTRISSGHSADYDFKISTPWKFGVSFGHTVGNFLALGATYEYADYSTIDNRINDGSYYDSWTGDFYQTSSKDREMNADTKANLRGVSTLKMGVEMKPSPELAVRLGYNYVSPVFKKDAFRDGTVFSPGAAYATSTDYTNWEDTHRLTAGIGYSVKKFSFDVAYQYNVQNGKFYPFMRYEAAADENPEYSNIPPATNVSFKRHQLLLTVGYTF